jgi:DNA helicase HerA-like ATPase
VWAEYKARRKDKRVVVDFLEGIHLLLSRDDEEKARIKTRSERKEIHGRKEGGGK